MADLYYVSPNHWQNKEILLDDSLKHRFFTVMRLSNSFPICVTDGQGKVARGLLMPDRIIIEEIEDYADDRLPIDVYLAVLKRDKMDWAIAKLGELGVRRIVPTFTARSVIKKWNKNKLERCKKLLGAALEIRRKAWLTECSQPQMLSDVLDQIDVFFDQDGEAPKVLHFPLAVLVGPEGGLTIEEKKALIEQGAVSVKLTQGVLRAETAAIVGVTVVACRGGLLW